MNQSSQYIRDKIKNFILETYYTTRKGERVKIKNMKVSHLERCYEKQLKLNNPRAVDFLRAALAIKNNNWDRYDMVEVIYLFVFDDNGEIKLDESYKIE